MPRAPARGAVDIAGRQLHAARRDPAPGGVKVARGAFGDAPLSGKFDGDSVGTALDDCALVAGGGVLRAYLRRWVDVI